MEEEFKIGKSYLFEAIIYQSNSSGNYICLRRGDRDTYRVKSYSFQEEDPDALMGQKLYCIVSSINIMNGLPVLRQDKGTLLKELYTAGEVYSFHVVAISQDMKTLAPFYQLSDRFGFDHRLYFKGEQQYVAGDEMEQKLDAIDVEKGILRLTDVKKTKQNYDSPVVETTQFGAEDVRTEFKTSIVFMPGNNQPDIDKQLTKLIRVISSFQNAEGGTLWIGVNNSGVVTGIEADFPYLGSGDDEFNASYKNDTDSYELKIRNTVNRLCGNSASTRIDVKFYNTADKRLYCAVEVSASKSPVFLNHLFLYQRSGNQTIQLKGDEITNYIKVRCADEIRGLIGEHFNAAPEHKTMDAVIVGSVEVAAPVAIRMPLSAQQEEVWNYFTYYENGKWSFQKDAIGDDSVICEIAILKSQKDHPLMMCYDNGSINVVIPTEQRKGKDRHKLYQGGWNMEAELLDMFITAPYNLIVAYSTDNEGVNRVKAHSVTDFNSVKSMSAKGSTIVSPKLGVVSAYKLVDIENKVAIPSLILEKTLTSQSLGFRLTEPAYKEEIAFLNKL